MKNYYFFFVLSFGLMPLLTKAQSVTITDLNQISINQIVNNFAGSGLQITNITHQGNAAQIGYFNGNTGTGLSSGVILSSGDVHSASNTNVSGSTTTIYNGAGDIDLATISSGQVNDAAVITIEFIPFGDTIIFNYVFASEEYPEWVGSNFNDVFGFFISSPGVPTQNIALIPGTTMPVSINNVNAITNSAYYVPNTLNQIEYDGYTVSLQARAVVVPNQTYTLKVAVSDIGDWSYDSAVFLEFGSFSSVGNGINPITGIILTPDFSSEIHEGCLDGSINFVLQNPILSDTTIHYTIGGSAQNGIDYQMIADSVTILAGQSAVSIPVHAIADNVIEGQENILLIYQTLSGIFDTLQMFLNESNDLYPISFTDTTVCQSEPLTVAYINGNTSNNTFVWQSINPSTSWYNNLNTLISNTAIGTQITTKGCMRTDTVTVTVETAPNPIITCQAISTDSIIVTWFSTGNVTQTEININNTGWISTNNGIFGHIISGLAPFSTVNIEVRCFGFCADSIPVVATSVCNSWGCSMISTANLTNVSCNGGNDGSATYQITNGNGGYTYLWSNGDTTASVTNLAAGSYQIIVTDAFNCTFSDNITISEPDAITVGFVVSSDTSNMGVGSATPIILGGTAPYNLTWSSGTSTNLTQGTYFLTITDANNCSIVDSFYVDNIIVGTNGLIQENAVEIYPNPANDFINIRLNLDKNYPTELKIYSVDGRLIAQQLTSSSQLNNTKISTADLPTGTYILQLLIENQLITKRLIIQ